MQRDRPEAPKGEAGLMEKLGSPVQNAGTKPVLLVHSWGSGCASGFLGQCIFCLLFIHLVLAALGRHCCVRVSP